MIEKINLEKLAGNSKGKNQLAFMSAYTGIESSQINALSDEHAKKVFLGLYKQLDLITMLHGKPTQEALHHSVDDYFQGTQDMEKTASQINSLMVFGDVRPLEGTGLEHLHKRLGHFWRILGWEELGQMEQGDTKLQSGSIEEVQRSSGNLIRTLDLLAEQWKENHIGPHLIYPQSNEGDAKVTRQVTTGYGLIKRQDKYSNSTVVLSSQKQSYPSEDDKKFYDSQTNLLQRLLDRYPMEIAIAVYDYHAFVEGLGEKKLNIAYVQEYKQNGTLKVKGVINGKGMILLGKQTNDVFNYQTIAASINESVVGMTHESPFETFNIETDSNSFVTFVQGKAAVLLAENPADVGQLSVHPTKIAQHLLNYTKQSEGAFSKNVPYSRQGKPICSTKLVGVSEYQSTPITVESIGKAGESISQYLRKHNVQFVNIEAGHIHADATPTTRQKTGISIGAQLSKILSGVCTVKKTTMIDEDHVPNALDHVGYSRLMHELGFELDELIYESSPAIREIAISAIVSLQQQYPDHVYKNGQALMFNIPDTDLQVELIKDIAEPDVELGCVIFDVGLTLAKVYPQLADTYLTGGSAAVHAAMQKIYTDIQSPSERQRAVKKAFPNKTRTYEEALVAKPLPEVDNVNSAVINVLERFYDGQQVKLEGMLRALKIPIHLVDVTFSDQGLHVNMSTNGFSESN
ncbi:hypothetical protein HZC27_05055 [Candidatus Roizmanbacteria bacterium]|nr:hypothetical protein [Candidatus Roizmanbacteria bacterium]